MANGMSTSTLPTVRILIQLCSLSLVNLSLLYIPLPIRITNHPRQLHSQLLSLLPPNGKMNFSRTSNVKLNHSSSSNLLGFLLLLHQHISSPQLMALISSFIGTPSISSWSCLLSLISSFCTKCLLSFLGFLFCILKLTGQPLPTNILSSPTLFKLQLMLSW